ncbi:MULTISPECIES: sensor histidine kinase [Burkholderiaceae]|uniref:histidine kinase n=1 Tax=Caballeronia sordidicola TaxID=196367 RepID=A0A226X4G1_CABSO|nr:MULTISPECIES: ATP-binding protein [Burkholderiaceae]OXC78321.1 Two-component hybrid sensor and regulator [Caballeronia sordidicola]
MMHNFLTNNRSALIERCKVKVSKRPARHATEQQLENGVPLFLDQLINTLRIEQTSRPMDSRTISGPSGGGITLSDIGVAAAQHGKELMGLGFSIDQVVHDYGDLCQAITDLAYERDAPFEIDEFRTLNRCLDNAIADAVTEFSYQHDSAIAAQTLSATTERFGAFVHELRNALLGATFAFDAVKAGNMNWSGATGSVLERSLDSMDKLIKHAVIDVRIAASGSAARKQFHVAEFIAEVRESGMMMATMHRCVLTVSPVESDIVISGDRDLLYAAVGNLLQNAFKFTHSHTEVTLNAYAVADRILIDVADHCGGLSPGAADKMFMPFKQNGKDKSGLGLGLSIARRAVEANGGSLSVRNAPGIGCIFTISLPRHELLDR